MFKKILLCLSLAYSSIALANLPFYPVQFPRDEAAHYSNVPYPVTNISEWWYYNGKLTTVDGRHFGYYISYNRFQLDFYGHKLVVPRLEIQITDIDKQVIYGNSFMPDIKDTIFSTEKLSVKFNKKITLEKENNSYIVNASVTSKKGEALKLALRLTPTRDVLLINGNGLGDMWSDTNTYYYSQTHLNTEGFLEINNDKFVLDNKTSLSWMDHQWGDFFIIPGINQWTWSSIQLDNGLELNISNVLDPSDPKAKKLLRSGASIVMPDGSHFYTNNVKIDAIPDATHKHPLLYQVNIPEINLSLELNSLVPDQDINGISEGISEASGLFHGTPVKGVAYAESTVNN